MTKQEAINAFGSVLKLAKAIGCSDKAVYKMPGFTYTWQLTAIGAAYLLGFVDRLDVENVRAELLQRTKPKTDAL